jgi:hydrogenase expression/formation protein HypE
VSTAADSRPRSMRLRRALEPAENAIPVHEAVEGACKILGLDPPYVAERGKAGCHCRWRVRRGGSASDAGTPSRPRRPIIGQVVREHASLVLMKTVVGGTRIVEVMFGERLPRIC